MLAQHAPSPGFDPQHSLTPGVVGHSCNANIHDRGMEAGGSEFQKVVLTCIVQGQPGLHGALSFEEKKKNKASKYRLSHASVGKSIALQE